MSIWDIARKVPNLYSERDFSLGETSVTKYNSGDSEGFDINLLKCVAGNSTGFDITGVKYVDGNSTGVDISLFKDVVGNSTGVDISLLKIVGGNFRGVDITVLKQVKGDSKGVGVGIVNFVEGTSSGVYASLAGNGTRRAEGILFQCGFANEVEEDPEDAFVVQVGAFNKIDGRIFPLVYVRGLENLPGIISRGYHSVVDGYCSLVGRYQEPSGP